MSRSIYVPQQIIQNISQEQNVNDLFMSSPNIQYLKTLITNYYDDNIPFHKKYIFHNINTLMDNWLRIHGLMYVQPTYLELHDAEFNSKLPFEDMLNNLSSMNYSFVIDVLADLPQTQRFRDSKIPVDRWERRPKPHETRPFIDVSEMQNRVYKSFFPVSDLKQVEYDDSTYLI